MGEHLKLSIKEEIYISPTTQVNFSEIDEFISEIGVILELIGIIARQEHPYNCCLTDIVIHQINAGMCVIFIHLLFETLHLKCNFSLFEYNLTSCNGEH